jgi:dihydropyrimidinase
MMQRNYKMKTLIKGGKLVTAEKTFSADILVENDKISQIGQNLQAPEAEVLDASGKFILPGGVDPHVHLDLPMAGTVSSDDHYTGTKAAALGGTTTVIDFVSFDFPLCESRLTRVRKLPKRPRWITPPI